MDSSTARVGVVRHLISARPTRFCCCGSGDRQRSSGSATSIVACNSMWTMAAIYLPNAQFSIFIIFLAAHLSVEACVLCGISQRLQPPKLTFDLAKASVSQIAFGDTTQAFQFSTTPMQPILSLQKEIQKEIRVSEQMYHLQIEKMRLTFDKMSGTTVDNEIDKEKEDMIEVGDDTQKKLKELLMSWIRWYRNTLSPIMPPNCRFLPSCSNYALQSIDDYGPTRQVKFSHTTLYLPLSFIPTHLIL